MNRRSSKRLDAYRDGELSPRLRERVERRLASDSGAARHVERTAAVGSAVRDAWREGPPAPSPEFMIALLRPEMDRLDAELAGAARLGAWLELLRRLVRPVPAGVLAAACTVLLLVLPSEVGQGVNPVLEPLAESDVSGEVTPIYDLAQGEQPLMILKGEDGSTVIWILEDAENLSGFVADGWA